jgi:hypothetical protein
MRKIDHTKRYSAEDIAFLRQMGVPYANDWIARNAEEHGYDPNQSEVPEDTVSRTVIGAEGGVGNGAPVIDPATGAPRLVDPTNPEDVIGGKSEDVDDDYDKWTVAELEADVKARNEMPDTTEVQIVGTGKDGKVIKTDLIKGLRLWDADNPGALSDGDED